MLKVIVHVFVEAGAVFTHRGFCALGRGRAVILGGAGGAAAVEHVAEDS